MLSRKQESGATAAAASGMRIGDWIWLGIACALVLGVYAWSAQSGVLEQLGGEPARNYYNLLAEGFNAGQLNLKTDVPPGLLELSDPYNPSANRPFRLIERHPLWDTSYFRGKLYLYFGATPAVVLFWPYAVLTGHFLWHREAALFFSGLGFLASAGLLWSIWRRYFGQITVAVVAAGTLTLGLAAGTPLILPRCDVYEVAISCGYALVMLALSALWCALHNPPKRGRWVAAASLAYGLAIAARPSLLFGAVILLAPAAQSWRAGQKIGSLLACATAPIAMIGLLVMAYNQRRFGNPFEFGTNYMLNGDRQAAMTFFSWRHVGFNVGAYFLEPVAWSGRFPFVHDIGDLPQPKFHGVVEHPFGVLMNTPVTWLALAAPLAWRNRLENWSGLSWFTAAVATLFMICAATLTSFYATCVRYQMEFAPELLLLAVIGIFRVEAATAAWMVWRGLARWGWGLFAAFSIVFSLCAGIELRREAPISLGATLLLMGKVEEAVAEFRQAVANGASPAWAHFYLGYALIQQGRVEEAIANYQMALVIKPDFAKAHNNLGTALRRTKRLDDAITHLREAVKIEPDFAEAHNNLGTALRQQGHLDEAIQHFRRALEIQPDLVVALDNLGGALLRQGKMDEAIVHLSAALAADPGDALAENNLGSALRQKGRLSDAIPHLEKAVELQPDFVEAQNNLGSALLQAGRTTEAIGHLEKALGFEPDLVEAQNNLGYALLVDRRIDEAIVHFQIALKNGSDVAETHNNFGSALFLKGRVDEAISHYREALRLKPGYTDASNGLAVALASKQKSAGQP